MSSVEIGGRTPLTSISFFKPGLDDRANLNRATLDKCPVFVAQRNNVGHSAKRDQIEFRFEIEFIDRARLKQRVAKFKHDADAAKIMKR